MATRTSQPESREVRDLDAALPYGMDGGADPMTLSPGRYSRGVNISIRDGYARTRPGWAFVADLGVGDGVNLQGAARWRSLDEYIVSVFNGNIYFFNVSTKAVTVITLVVSPGRQVFFTQADELLVVADGTSSAAFNLVDGVPKKVFPLAPLTADSLQPCSILAYCQGRIYSVPRLLGFDSTSAPANDRYFVSGDILKAGDPLSLLGATETQTLDGGLARGLPGEMGPIRGLTVAQNPGKSNGLGPLLVFCRDGVAAFDVSINRASVRDPVSLQLITPGWADSAIGAVLEYGVGTDSPWSLIQSGTDIFFRGRDGIYSLARDREAVQSGAVSVPSMSYEVQPWIQQETELFSISGAIADHRMFMTSVAGDSGGYRGVLTLDTLATATANNDKGVVAWCGLWTGPTFGQILDASYQSAPALHTVTPDGKIYRLDNSYKTDSGTPIESQLTTRALFATGETGIAYYKWLSYIDVWLSEITRDTSIEVFFRPDGYPLWTRIGCPKVITVAEGSLPQERRKMRFSCRDGAEYPENDRRPGMNSGSLRHGYTFQIKLVIAGNAIIKRIDAVANLVSEEPPSQETEDTTGKIFSVIPSAFHTETNDFTQPPPGVNTTA